MNTIRMLGRKVEYLGKIYSLSLIEATADPDGMWHVSVTPFERETASTPYHGGTVRISFPGGTAQPPLIQLLP